MLNSGGGKIDALGALDITNMILVSLPTRSCHSWASLYESTKFLGSVLASASIGEKVVLQAQTAVVIVMELSRFKIAGFGVNWQQMVSNLCSIFVAGRLTRLFSSVILLHDKKLAQIGLEES